MDDDDKIARISAVMVENRQRAAKLGVGSETGHRVFALLERDGDVSLTSLLSSFQADIDRYTGNNPDADLGVLQARAVIAKIRSVTGKGGSTDPET